MAGTGVSTATAVGIDSRNEWAGETGDLDTPSQYESEQESIEEKLDEGNRSFTNGETEEREGGGEERREKKHVKFKDDNISSSFDDTDLWAHGNSICTLTVVTYVLLIDPNESAQDMINAYQRECMAMKIKPIQILLDQLKVRC